jgi:hypothetical protein
MAKKANGRVTPVEVVQSHIFLLRGCRVMLDRDLAELYGVETRVLNQGVKRNLARFPIDFMFRMTASECKEFFASRSQTVILKRGQNLKHLPLVFTEHGAVMLANVLKSPAAIRAGIQVVRAFVNLRNAVAAGRDVARKVFEIEARLKGHDAEFDRIFASLDSLLNPSDSEPPKRPIGFLPSSARR